MRARPVMNLQKSRDTIRPDATERKASMNNLQPEPAGHDRVRAAVMAYSLDTVRYLQGNGPRPELPAALRTELDTTGDSNRD